MPAMAAATRFARFPTAIGECAIVWGEAGIRGLMLPGVEPAHMLSSLRRRHPQAREAEPTAAIADALRRVQALLVGEADHLQDICLDMDGVPAFHRRVYDAARRIGPGRTCSYGELAEALGEPGAARSVGQALGANPFALIVPCHRVLAARGASGGFSAPGGVETKRRLLEIERARIGDQPQLF